MEKITVVHMKDSRGLYGAERAILTLAKHIDKAQFDFVLLCLQSPDGLAKDLIREAKQLGIALEIVNVKGRLDIPAIGYIRRILKHHDVSILHTHDFKTTFYALLASLNLGIKRVVTAHGSTRDSWLMKAYLFLDEHIVYRFFDRIVAVAEHEAALIRGKGVAARKVEVIPNAIDLITAARETSAHASCPLPATDGRHNVCGVIGRLFPDKGHRFFLEAFEHVVQRHPAARAHIVGGGPLDDVLGREVRDRKLERHVCLCGVRSDMPEVYSELGFVVIPSLREGLPYVLLEALAHRVPVLATAVGDIPRLIKHGKTGFLAPPGDARALETYMLRLLHEPEEARVMAEAGYRLVVEQYPARRMVDATERLYTSLKRKAMGDNGGSL
jgi:glycosyltransferase involved in cell wall biosynthesis